MNHTWEKENKTTSFCKVCGCKKTIDFIGGRTYNFYQRSGMPFGLKRPDCINEEVENAKTID